MLRELRIADFAIIDELTLAFAPSFNVFTGETGAGKSIVVQALSLLCGGRASPEAIRADSEEAEIEGLFDLGPDERRALESAGLPAADDLVVRRLISRGGRSRVYLNGNLASLAVLERLGPALVHVYGQHEQALLLRPDSHLELLDTYAGVGGDRARMAARFEELDGRLRRLAEVRGGQDAARQRAELARFQLQELEAAALEPGEEERLRREREVLAHAEKLLLVCQEGETALYSGDDAVEGAVARIAAQVREAARIDPSLGESYELLESARAQLQEAARSLRAYGERVSFDPARREAVEDRIALLGRLKRKYGGSIDAAIAARDELRAELRLLDGAETDVPALAKQVAEAAAAAWEVAVEMSRRRRQSAKRLEAQMERELCALGMEGASFQVAFAHPPPDGTFDPEAPLEAETARLTACGADAAEFMLSANPGEPPKPLAKIASGGELSRIMLALKVLTAAAGEVPTLIFDEVDAGIGGHVAEAVGVRLGSLGKSRQVLCITHLPQIAARADHHFVVEKRLRGGRTVSGARRLDEGETVTELSRMLGGTDDSEAGRFARRLIAGRNAPVRSRGRGS